jgi:hypothetical protein
MNIILKHFKIVCLSFLMLVTFLFVIAFHSGRIHFLSSGVILGKNIEEFKICRITFSGNLLGNYNSNGCGLRGSLSRRKSLKNYLHPNIDIDLGNFYGNNDEVNLLQANILFNLSGLNLINVTENDCPYLNCNMSSKTYPISMNNFSGKIDFFKTYHIRKGKKILFSGISIFRNLDSIDTIRRKIEREKADIKILLINNSYDNIEYISSNFSGFDVVLAIPGFEKNSNKVVLKKGMLCSYVEGRYRSLGVIDIYLKCGHIYYNAYFIPISKFLKRDSNIEEIIKNDKEI